jgi:hypothetical protein
MRNFDADIAAELAKEILHVFFMLEFQFASDTYRYNDMDIDVYASGKKFSPVSFKFENLSGSAGLAVESFDVEIDDTNLGISSIILNEDVRNKTAILYLGVVTSAQEIVTEEFLRGIVGGWKILDDNIVRISITNEMVLWNKRTLRSHAPTCPWTFKGTECAYAGAQTWCDQSHDRCYDLSNTDNFGGFRFLPSIMERKIWWGRTPK